MTDSTTVPIDRNRRRWRIAASAFDVFVLTVQCRHAADMILRCAGLLDDPTISPDDRRLAREIGYDYRYALAEAREQLVDLGANVREATGAILGLSELGGSSR